jgi:5-methylcytosine-specific restriction endonuclease McrA
MNKLEAYQKARQDAGNKCQRCGAPDRTAILRSTVDPARYIIFVSDKRHYIDPITNAVISADSVPGEYVGNLHTFIVVIVDHADGDETNFAPMNLTVLCQRCHRLHGRSQNYTKLRENGQQSLW